MNNVGDLWELDLADMDSMALHKEGHSYFLNATDASKYAYSVPIRSKTGEAVVLAIRSILARNCG